MLMHNPPHPGEILRALYMVPLNLTVTQAALNLKVTRKTLSMLLNGKAGVSAEMAWKLSKAFNTTAEHWSIMQSHYDLWQAQQRVDLNGIKVINFSDIQKPEIVKT